MNVVAASAHTHGCYTVEQLTRQAEKLAAMGQLTGGLAHEMNNLLAPMMAAFDMLSRPGISLERTRILTERGLLAVNRAKSLVQQLLAFAGRQPLQASAVDVGTLVTGVANRIRSLVGPLIEVTLNIDQHVGLANADPAQLETAILNLSSNARDAMPEGGILRVRVTADTSDMARQLGPCVRISIQDNGIGMDDVTRIRAVEPFFSTKGVGKGIGLGLSMAHGIALQLGGTLTVSSGLGVGTNVELFLPIRRRSVGVPRAADSTERAPHSIGTVLLVDDDDSVRACTADMLRQLGFAILEASSAEEALKVIRRGAYLDLLITDHVMPGMTGTDLVCAVRQQRPQIPVLIISGFAEDQSMASDLLRLTKPFAQTELADCIAALLH
jgi:nitrogen-specific signal transduction histidine kinase/CheY-like chemotaxis protein